MKSFFKITTPLIAINSSCRNPTSWSQRCLLVLLLLAGWAPLVADDTPAKEQASSAESLKGNEVLGPVDLDPVLVKTLNPQESKEAENADKSSTDSNRTADDIAKDRNAGKPASVEDVNTLLSAIKKQQEQLKSMQRQIDQQNELKRKALQQVADDQKSMQRKMEQHNELKRKARQQVEEAQNNASWGETRRGDETLKERRVRFQQQIDELSIQLVDLLRDYGQDSPLVQKANQKIEILSEMLERQDDEFPRVYVLSVEGRSAADVTRILAKIFSDTVTVTEDESTNSVLIKINDDVAASEVPLIQKEMQSIIESLKSQPQKPSPPKEARVIHEADPTDRGLDVKIRTLVEEYRANRFEEQRAELAGKITDLTAQQFDHRQARRYSEFQAFERRVEQLKAANARRYANRKEIVQRRVSDLLNPNSKTEWDDVETTAPSGEIRSQEKPFQLPTYDASPATSESKPTTSNTRPTTFDPTTNEEATYSGKTVSEWLRILRRERNPIRLPEVLDAFLDLRNDVEPRLLMDEVLQCIRRVKPGDDINPDVKSRIFDNATKLFSVFVNERRLTADDVADAIVREIESNRNNPVCVEFLDWFLTSNRPKDNFAPNSLPKNICSELITAIRAKRNRLVLLLVIAANRDDSLRGPVVSCAWTLFGNESISEWPDLVEVVVKSLNGSRGLKDCRGFSIGLAAAELLAVSRINPQAALDHTLEEMRADFKNWETPSGQFFWLLPYARIFDALAGQKSEAIEGRRALCEFVMHQVEEILAKVRNDANWVSDHGPQSTSQNENATAVLIRIRPQADEMIPRLREQLIQTEMECSKVEGRLERAKPILDPIAKLIRKFEGDQSASPKTTQSDVKGEATKAKSTIDAAPSQEKTYDGVPYSVWLRQLETDRKPERVIAAIEAVSSLAPAEDANRIARLIFLAEADSQAGNATIPAKVKEAGKNALLKLPASVVLDELVIAIGKLQTQRSAGEFECELLLSAYIPRFATIFADRFKEVVDAAIPLIPDEPNNDYLPLVRALSTSCVRVRRSLKDFPELYALAQKYFLAGPQGRNSDRTLWANLASTLIQSAPETPGLRKGLVSQFDNMTGIVEMLGELAPTDPEVATDLIKHFEMLLKRTRQQILEFAGQGANPERAFEAGEIATCSKIIGVLAGMNDNPRAGNFLAKLGRYTPSNSERWRGRERKPIDGLFETIGLAHRSFPHFKIAPDATASTIELPDFFKCNGVWKMQSEIRLPRYSGETGSIDIRGISCDFGRGDNVNPLGETRRKLTQATWTDLLPLEWFGDFSAPFHTATIVLDDSKSPKQLSLQPMSDDRDRRIQGIYKLDDDQLIMKLSRLGTPRPTKFESDDDAPDPNQVQFHFKREAAVSPEVK